MTATNSQKLKLLYLMQVLERETDTQQGLTMPQIIERLEALGVSAERKSLYRDIQALREIGYDIRKLSTRPVQYCLERSSLGFDDIMMLVDAVQSSRFVTNRKSDQLVKSLKELTSLRERKLLAKRVHVQGRVKSANESVFRNVDCIHDAMQGRRKIQFQYFSYGTDLRRRARHGGKRYVLTPVKVVYAENNYYLAAFDDADGKIKTYRIDRMEMLGISDVAATRNAEIANYEFQEFAYRSFGMFHGDPATVTLRVQAPLMDAVVDRFGRSVDLAKSTEDYADVRVNVHVSPQFFGWVAGLDGGVTIRFPRKVAGQYRDWLTSLVGDASQEDGRL